HQRRRFRPYDANRTLERLPLPESVLQIEDDGVGLGVRGELRDRGRAQREPDAADAVAAADPLAQPSRERHLTAQAQGPSMTPRVSSTATFQSASISSSERR